MLNVFAFLRLLGQDWLAKEIEPSLKHHLSAAGAAQLSAELSAAADGLAKQDYAAAAKALAAVVVAIH